MGFKVFYYIRSFIELALIAFSLFSFNKVKVDRSKIIKAIVIEAIVALIMGILPIEHIIQIFTNIIMIFLIAYNVYKFEIKESIKVSLITIIIMIVTEMVGILSIMLYSPDLFNTLMEVDIYKASFYTCPVLIPYIIIVFCYYYSIKKKNKLRIIN